ncbi:spore germination protein [Anaerobacillus alkalilacustris]|uniref:Spore germination protein n=2 Tax=Anaerobacillus alkalilacustris TaxID=393763 RepID=A0A1S2LIG4_9BACI|nr:spore germination protein [Anaerobacillus alkalilacustris]
MKQSEQSKQAQSNTDEPLISDELTSNLDKISTELGNSSDLAIRRFTVATEIPNQGAVIYIDGLIDEDAIRDFILEPLMGLEVNEVETKDAPKHPILHTEIETLLPFVDMEEITDWKSLYLSLLSGKTILLVEGSQIGFALSTQNGNWRGIQEPQSEISVKGAKDSFIESLSVNLTLIRRRLKTQNLWLETFEVGELTQTNVGIMYVKGIVNDKIVQEVKERINRIDTDEVVTIAQFQEFIEDETFTPFPTVFVTERPDVAVGHLLEGKVILLVDGNPVSLIVPVTLPQFFHAAEDYYQRYDISSLIRILRYISFLIALLGPSIYVAAITFHQDLIPTTLLVSLAAQREGVPFPALIEAVLMEFTFEVLREAGIRMPRAIGQAVSIVGALVIGQAAVQAGIVSASMVIVVAATGIASFTTPSYDLAVSARMLRFIMMIFAGTFGFYGITLALLMLVAHLCSLRSFGIPYLTPFAPFNLSDQKDAIFRLPIWANQTRPRLYSQKNKKRMKQGLQPSPKKT